MAVLVTEPHRVRLTAAASSTNVAFNTRLTNASTRNTTRFRSPKQNHDATTTRIPDRYARSLASVAVWPSFDHHELVASTIQHSHAERPAAAWCHTDHHVVECPARPVRGRAAGCESSGSRRCDQADHADRDPRTLARDGPLPAESDPVNSALAGALAAIGPCLADHECALAGGDDKNLTASQPFHACLWLQCR
jgi:hypothetical protein